MIAILIIIALAAALFFVGVERYESWLWRQPRYSRPRRSRQ